MPGAAAAIPGPLPGASPAPRSPDKTEAARGNDPATRCPPLHPGERGALGSCASLDPGPRGVCGLCPGRVGVSRAGAAVWERMPCDARVRALCVCVWLCCASPCASSRAYAQMRPCACWNCVHTSVLLVSVVRVCPEAPVRSRRGKKKCKGKGEYEGTEQRLRVSMCACVHSPQRAPSLPPGE